MRGWVSACVLACVAYICEVHCSQAAAIAADGCVDLFPATHFYELDENIVYVSGCLLMCQPLTRLSLQALSMHQTRWCKGDKVDTDSERGDEESGGVAQRFNGPCSPQLPSLLFSKIAVAVRKEAADEEEVREGGQRALPTSAGLSPVANSANRISSTPATSRKGAQLDLNE